MISIGSEKSSSAFKNNNWQWWVKDNIESGSVQKDVHETEIEKIKNVCFAFIAIFAPALRTVAHIAAAFVAIVLALSLAWLPWSLGLIVAAFAGMIVGAEIERRKPELIS